MAAKFSMANPAGLFDSGAHLEASDRLQGAAEQLKERHARQDVLEAAQAKRSEAQALEQQRRLARSSDIKAAALASGGDARLVRSKQNEEEQEEEEEDPEEQADADSDDELLDEMMRDADPELERLRARRLAELKQQMERERELKSRGHGEYREIAQDEFLKEVTGAPLALVHFYHRDFERCKIMDMHLARLAPRHVECKFLKMNAEKAPFFVEKLAVRVLPTVVCFRDGVAFPARVLGFDGLSDASDEQQELDAFGSRAAHRLAAGSDSFPTAALARKLADIGAIYEHDESDDERE